MRRRVCVPSEGDGEDICIGKTVSEALATSQGAFRRFPVFTRTGGMVVIDAHLGPEASGGDIEYTVNWGCAVAEGPGMTNGLSYVEFECLSGARGWDGTDVPLYVGVARRGLSVLTPIWEQPCRQRPAWALRFGGESGSLPVVHTRRLSRDSRFRRRQRGFVVEGLAVAVIRTDDVHAPG